MLKRSDEKKLREKAKLMIRETGLPITEQELDSIDVADFGLSHPEQEGAQILTLFATERISTKLIVLFPGQNLPEHWHPPVGNDPGKEEIIRGLYGSIVYGEEGNDNHMDEYLPMFKQEFYSSRSIQILAPARQVIIPSGKKHWLSGGKDGGIVLSFSTCVRDALDQFTDPEVKRITEFEEDI